MAGRQYDARQGVLDTPEFKALATAALSVFSANSLALIGGLAVSHYANPPVTVDADFLTQGTCGDVLEACEGFTLPWVADLMEFPGSLPQHCVRVAHRTKPLVLDFLATGKHPYLLSVVERAVAVEVQRGVWVPIARAEDVIVLKTIAGREKDKEDIATLGVRLGGKIDRAYIERILKGLS